MDSSKLRVLLSGVPENCELKLIKAEILKILNIHAYEVSTIKKCRDAGGKIIPGKLLVQFTSSACK